MTEAEMFAAGIAQRRPELVARVLEREPAAAGAELLGQLPADAAAAVLACMMPREATQRLRAFSADGMPQVLAELSPTTAAGLLRPLAPDEIDALLAGTPERISKPLRFLLRYPETVVGAWMQTGPLLLPQDVDVAGALALARAGTADLDRLLFVVDRRSRLLGAVAAAALLREDPERPVGHLMRKAPFALHTRTDLRAAVEHPGWQQCDPLPVINRERRVVGLVHHAVLRRALHEGSVSPLAESPVSGSLVELLELSWQGLADLLEGALRWPAGPAQRSRTESRDV